MAYMGLLQLFSVLQRGISGLRVLRSLGFRGARFRV